MVLFFTFAGTTAMDTAIWLTFRLSDKFQSVPQLQPRHCVRSYNWFELTTPVQSTWRSQNCVRGSEEPTSFSWIIWGWRSDCDAQSNQKLHF